MTEGFCALFLVNMRMKVRYSADLTARGADLIIRSLSISGDSDLRTVQVIALRPKRLLSSARSASARLAQR